MARQRPSLAAERRGRRGSRRVVSLVYGSPRSFAHSLLSLSLPLWWVYLSLYRVSCNSNSLTWDLPSTPPPSPQSKVSSEMTLSEHSRVAAIESCYLGWVWVGLECRECMGGLGGLGGALTEREGEKEGKGKGKGRWWVTDRHRHTPGGKTVKRSWDCPAHRPTAHLAPPVSRQLVFA